MADQLQAELGKMGRSDWAETEFGDFLSSTLNRADQERWRRLPGLHQPQPPRARSCAADGPVA